MVQEKDNIIYSLLIQMMKHLCMNSRTIIHVYGELDLTTLTHEDLYKLKESLTRHKDVIIVACKNKGIVKKGCDPLIKTLVFKEQKYKLMENRLDRVHISMQSFFNAHLKIHNCLIHSMLQSFAEGQKFVQGTDRGLHFCKETNKICKNALFLEFLAYLHFLAWLNGL